MFATSRSLRALRIPVPALALTLFLSAAATDSVRAEGTPVDLTLSVGGFSSTQNNLDETVAGIGDVTAKFGSSPIIGGRVGIWLNDHLAIEGTGYYAGGSSLEGEAFGVPGSVDASFFYGSGRLVVGLGADNRVMLTGGIGTQKSTYDTTGIEDGSLMVGVLGVSAQFPIGESVSLRIDADNYLYNMYWEFDGLQSEEQFMRDFVLAAGLTFHTGR
ncbi:MAG: hypothetical protein HKN12_07665 [Gemmatimonadetes bacterium]|nr:hypothetical protein [Gemmatimonadota bacterium]